MSTTKENLESSSCSHVDTRQFDGIRCCMSCGLAYVVEIDHDMAFSAETNVDITNEPKSSPYKYEDLHYELGQEIRLAVIQPGIFSDEIKCKIVLASLDDHPTFEALSYTWADGTGNAKLTEEFTAREILTSEFPPTANPH